MAPYTNMPADVKVLAEKTEAAITDRLPCIRSNALVAIEDGKTVECTNAMAISTTARS